MQPNEQIDGLIKKYTAYLTTRLVNHLQSSHAKNISDLVAANMGFVISHLAELNSLTESLARHTVILENQIKDLKEQIECLQKLSTTPSN